MSTKVELVVDARAEIGEGPVWHPLEQRLWWVDILGGALHVHDPQGEPDRLYPVGRMVGAAVPRKAGGMILAAEDGFAEFDPASGRITPIADPERDMPNTRFNDGKCDPRGRFWAGTLSKDRQPGVASLYCLDLDHNVRRVLTGVTTSNGLDWSLDGKTLYYIDTPTRQVSAFDFDVDHGIIANRRVVISFADEPGWPDGMTIDAEGMLWIVHWGGSCVSRWNPGNGRKLRQVDLPTQHVSSCTFGGKNLDQLYITTACHGLTGEQLREQSGAGGLFEIGVGTSGIAANLYEG